MGTPGLPVSGSDILCNGPDAEASQCFVTGDITVKCFIGGLKLLSRFVFFPGT